MLSGIYYVLHTFASSKATIVPFLKELIGKFKNKTKAHKILIYSFLENKKKNQFILKI